MSKTPCPCCSGQSYQACCESYISGKSAAPAPEALMRSRYTAYTQANTDYIFATMQGKALKDADKTSTKEWANSVEWLKLEVLDAPIADSDEGYVEFIAQYKEQGQKQQMHERSRFIKKAERWYYVDGKQLGKQPNRTPHKIGRNEPCPCCSGQKYKRCCGK